MDTLWTLSPKDRAAFAASSRLLACLTTESLLTTLFVPAPHAEFSGVALLVSPAAAKHGRGTALKPEEIFAVVPLSQVPVFKPGCATEIGILDPLDMFPCIYEVHDQRAALPLCNDALAQGTLSILRANYISKDAVLAPSPGPLHLWRKYADVVGVSEDVHESIAAEIESSVLWQRYAYEHPPPAPTFDSPAIAWEQCIIEGHPTHPMHKARRTIDPIPPILPGAYDWSRPVIRFVSAPRAKMQLHGPWEALISPIRAAAETRAAATLPIPPDHVLVPVHELQLHNILHKFSDAQIYPPEFALDALAQQSIRTVLVPTPARTHCLKLALGVRLTSALRTISPVSAAFGPQMCSTVLPRLTATHDNPELLIVQRDLASAVYAHADPAVARHLAAIVREPLDDDDTARAQGERVIVCSALVETGHAAGVPLVETVFELDTKAKRLAWLDTFIATYLRAFLPPALRHGVALEAHPQNTLARFDAHTRDLVGFAVRDFGGVRVDAGALASSTTLNIDEARAVTGEAYLGSAEEVSERLYHALVHNMLQRLLRVLGLHASSGGGGTGEGWALVRAHGAKAMWAARSVPGKCFLRMRMDSLDRVHLRWPIPNLVVYGDERKEE